MHRITILTHADCDGICAGSIVLAKYPNANVFFTKPVSLLYDLEHTNADLIIITDIALSSRDARNILNEMERKKDIYYFDHHPLPDGITEKMVSSVVSKYIHRDNVSASELTYREYATDLPPERIWPAIYGAIGDYSDNTDFVKKKMLNWDKISLYFQVSTLMMGIKSDSFGSYDGKRRIIRTLANGGNPTDISGLVKSAREAVDKEFDLYDIVKRMAKKIGKIGYVKEVHGFGFRGPSALFAATVTNAPVGVCIDMKENKIDVTIRTRDYKYQLNKIADAAAQSVKGSGGGLPAAAGARIPKGTLDKFLKKMNSLL
jgi:RecJ-like exonuclease